MVKQDHLNKVEELKAKYEAELNVERIEALKEKERADLLKLDQQKADIQQSNNLIAILCLVILVMIILAILINRQLKIRNQKRAFKLEQSLLRSQMNPHFIFNSINSIQRLFLEGKSDVAGDFMADFATIMRSILDNSTQELITLSEELKILKIYLDFEKLRSSSAFEYTIVIDPKINPDVEKVPPLIFQPLVENAIWHGVLPAKKKGNIQVLVEANGSAGKLLCSVIDDGVGLRTDKTEKDHKSKALEICEQRLRSKIQLLPRAEGGTLVRFSVSRNNQ
jgi:LytS/YehU family sensor histidine kinase